jgi:hypothetical protein
VSVTFILFGLPVRHRDQEKESCLKWEYEMESDKAVQVRICDVSIENGVFSTSAGRLLWVGGRFGQAENLLDLRWEIGPLRPRKCFAISKPFAKQI